CVFRLPIIPFLSSFRVITFFKGIRITGDTVACHIFLYNMRMNVALNPLVPELSVASFEKSLDFYTRVLGFSVAYDRPEEGFAFLVLDGVQIMIDEIGKGRTWRTGE